MRSEFTGSLNAGIYKLLMALDAKCIEVTVIDFLKFEELPSSLATIYCFSENGGNGHIRTKANAFGFHITGFTTNMKDAIPSDIQIRLDQY